MPSPDLPQGEKLKQSDNGFMNQSSKVVRGIGLAHPFTDITYYRTGTEEKRGNDGLVILSIVSNCYAEPCGGAGSSIPHSCSFALMASLISCGVAPDAFNNSISC